MSRGRPKKKLNADISAKPKQFCFLCHKRGIESEMKYRLIADEYKCPICGYTKMES